MEWIKNLFKSQEESELTAWETKDSILAFLKQHVTEQGSLNDDAHTLPDEKKADDGIKFAPGLLDALVGADNSEKSKSRIKVLVKLITRIAQKGDAQSKSDFYKEVTENENVIAIIDEFLEQLVERSLPIEPHLYHYANSLATKTNNRNAVKFGIAMLGLCQNQEPIEDLRILGLHDEFTLFSSIALLNLSDDLVNDLWRLAKQVDGWGRIQLVERLVALELTDEIRDWLVLEGYRNDIMYEYLALTCAQSGLLNEKLKREAINNDLFVSAGEIIVALMDEGPTRGMSGYLEATETLENYVQHAKVQELSIVDFMNLHKIKDYLEDAPEKVETLKHWKQDELSNLLIDINTVLQSRDWTTEVHRALQSADSFEYWNAKQAADKLEIPIWETVWGRLKQNPLDFSLWYDVTANAKEGDVEEVIDLALNNLPLDKLGTGPKDSMGFGDDFQMHNALESVITLIGDYPGKGEALILVGLDSPVTRNKNMAISALEKWKAENWSTEITEKVNRLREIEPNENTKENIERLLSGEELA